ncbi:MAG: N-acetyl-gamma-glutamyl-phosphate reductase [Bacteroidales bacterium]
MIKVVIAGGTGYTAGELLRLLVHHPKVEVVAVLSRSYTGEDVATIHRDLIGECSLKFSATPPKELYSGGVDLLFLTLGHGVSPKYLQELNPHPSTKIIDLGNDYRLGATYKGERFIYGLPEKNRAEIKEAHYLANPGCFATSILLSLLPLAQNSLIKNEVHIHGITGSTGAGKNLTESTHFSYRHANISLYKPFVHQHIDEIEMQLFSHNGGASLQQSGESSSPELLFVPMRGDFTRGIFTSSYTKIEGTFSLSDMEQLYSSYYSLQPFVHLSKEPISLKEVVNTNRALIYLGKHREYLYITTAIDNLIKGASGQAVENMNLMFGFDQKEGLRLKGTSF